MEYMPEKELLNYALQNGILDIRTIQEKVEMDYRQKILNEHTFKIWQGNNGYWYSYLPDQKANNGRKLIKKKTLSILEDTIVKYYNDKVSYPTVAEMFTRWTDYKLQYKEITQGTYDRYVCDYDRFIKDKPIADMKVIDMTEEYLEDFIRDTILENNLTSKGYSGLRTILNGIFKYAKRLKYTSFSVSAFMQDIELSKKVFKHTKRKDLEQIFTDSELDTLINYLNQDLTLEHMAILLAIYTGMRVGEISALSADDIKGNFIYVNKSQTRYKVNGKYVFEIIDCAKTEAGTRTIPVVDALKPILDRLLQIHPNGYLFVKNGKVISKQAIAKELYTSCTRAGIEKKSMHKLRKTFATKLLNARVDDSIIIHIMGHTDITTTKQFYYYNDKGIKEMQTVLNETINF